MPGRMRDMATNRKTNRRPQAPKGTGENRAMVNAMQGKRYGSAAEPHRAGTDYRRKPKHFKGWE